MAAVVGTGMATGGPAHGALVPVLLRGDGVSDAPAARPSPTAQAVAYASLVPLPLGCGAAAVEPGLRPDQMAGSTEALETCRAYRVAEERPPADGN